MWILTYGMDSDPYCDEISSSGMNSYEDGRNWRFGDRM